MTTLDHPVSAEEIQRFFQERIAYNERENAKAECARMEMEFDVNDDAIVAKAIAVPLPPPISKLRVTRLSKHDRARYEEFERIIALEIELDLKDPLTGWPWSLRDFREWQASL